MSEALERPISACKCWPTFIVEWPVITALRENWTSWIGLQVPGTVWNNVTTSPARSCAFVRVSTRQWKGGCRAAERARSPARPFNRVNGKAALTNCQLFFYHFFCFRVSLCCNNAYMNRNLKWSPVYFELFNCMFTFNKQSPPPIFYVCFCTINKYIIAWRYGIHRTHAFSDLYWANVADDEPSLIRHSINQSIKLPWRLYHQRTELRGAQILSMIMC